MGAVDVQVLEWRSDFAAGFLAKFGGESLDVHRCAGVGQAPAGYDDELVVGVGERGNERVGGRCGVSGVAGQASQAGCNVEGAPGFVGGLACIGQELLYGEAHSAFPFVFLGSISSLRSSLRRSLALRQW